LALLVSAGCQSYYPNGYGHNGPYSAFPSGPYVPTTTTPGGSGATGKDAYPTPVNNEQKLQSGQYDPKDGNGSGPVPKYENPTGAPKNLGAPASDDEEDSINKNGTSRRRNSGTTNGSQGSDPPDDTDDSLTSVDDAEFASPVEYREAAPEAQQREPRRLAGKSTPSPYKKDPHGYRWLRGVVFRDSETDLWRLTYSRDDLDDDPYEGNLTLSDNPRVDALKLKDGDVILVEGALDRLHADRFNKPSYRVANVEGPLKPKSD
jgi:hypothetical protein